MKLFSKPSFFACIAVLFFNSLSAQALTENQWRSDLVYFKKLVHDKYANLFYNVTASQFDSAVAVFDKKLGGMNDLQRRAEFVKIVAMFHVGHTAVRRRAGSAEPLVPWVRTIPVVFYPFSDGIYIRSVNAKYKDAAGGKLLRIGNTNIETALQKIKPLVSFENEQGFQNMIQYYLNVPEFLAVAGIIDNADMVSVTYTKNGQEKSVTLPAEALVTTQTHGISIPAGWTDAYEPANQEQAVLWLKQPGKIRYFEYLADSKTVYVRHSAVQDESDETIAAFFDKVFKFVDNNDVNRFILDIRLNGGGNNYLNKPLITGLIQAKKINQRGKLFVIIGKATFSAAQNLTNELEKYTEAIFVGEPTSENVNFYGDTRLEVLPESKLNIALSWLWWQNLDPRDKRLWKAPQLAADLSFSDYKNGIDPAMKVIMNYQNQQPIEDQLLGFVRQGKFDDAVAVAKTYVSDPVHRYETNELEKKINDYGYSLMGKGNNEMANKILGMNVQLYPESANAYDSYAESFWKMGKKEEAIRYYQLALNKDPEGPTGENSKKMLAEIQRK